MTLNTTNGPVPNPHHHPTHVVNTSRVVEEDLIAEDEAPEILAVASATGWHAEMKDGSTVPLLVFVVTDEGEMYGTIVGENGRIDRK